MRIALLFAVTFALVGCDSGGGGAGDGGTGDGGGNAPCTGSTSQSVPSGQTEMRTYYATATVPYGQTCQSEVQTRGCTNGTWGAWTGTYKQASCTVDPGSCQGAPSDCTTMTDQAACTAQAGCTYPAPTCGPSTLTWNCSGATMQSQCTLPGCSWSGSACTGGTHNCSEQTTEANCGLASVVGCTWKSACTGTPSACSTFSTMASCGGQAGCVWQ